MEKIPRRRQAYLYIQQRILSGELPAGSQISELALAKEIGMSRMPVREAIRQLEVEGLVRQVPRVGTIVHSLDRAEMAELYEVREALESHTAETVAGRLSDEDLQMLSLLCKRLLQVARELRSSGKKTFSPKLLQSFLAADMGFHMVILRAGGNRRMMKIVADLRVLSRIFATQREPHDLKIVVNVYRFHRRILRQLKSGDGERARYWMQQHIRASRHLALESFDRRQALGDAKNAMPLALPEDLLEELNQIEAGEANNA
ncbi:GntR family transcriptional regulator [Blastopirellula sp. JC732]|uniref:GntR family transcriptional regulator n=1 Tax=Blastopirellula sediminis TaxID=2894196 RepID=A0A9X1ML33_9BACT|nr:GntR family transcriptional regulator [Blastopirellula sediminis]MCC9608946.1 GntR family transcriptional regulator [Blastopirellula sediminis]MCC9628277.1 GntR family transcriptional regulator [Blastopirellula sediminis]